MWKPQKTGTTAARTDGLPLLQFPPLKAANPWEAGRDHQQEASRNRQQDPGRFTFVEQAGTIQSVMGKKLEHSGPAAVIVKSVPRVSNRRQRSNKPNRVPKVTGWRIILSKPTHLRSASPQRAQIRGDLIPQVRGA